MGALVKVLWGIQHIHEGQQVTGQNRIADWVNTAQKSECTQDTTELVQRFQAFLCESSDTTRMADWKKNLLN